MDLDLLKQQWAKHDETLDACIHLNRQVLVAANLNGLRTPLRRFAFLAGAGALTGLLGAIVTCQFIYAHWAESRFALPAMALHVWLVAGLAASIRQLAMALRVDYGQPVAIIQEQLATLRVLRLRVIRWSLLTGQVVWWIPFLIVALRGFWGVDAYRTFGSVVLIANLALGLAIIPLAIWASARFGDRFERSPAIQGLMRELAGYNLNSAAGFLATVHEFRALVPGDIESAGGGAQ